MCSRLWEGLAQRQNCPVWLGMAEYFFTTSQNTLVCISFFDDNLGVYAGLIQEEKTKETKSTESQGWIWEKLKSIF